MSQLTGSTNPTVSKYAPLAQAKVVGDTDDGTGKTDKNEDDKKDEEPKTIEEKEEADKKKMETDIE
jgi:hypothetical protein